MYSLHKKILCTILLFSLVIQAGESEYRNILLAEYQLHPHSTVQDFYKFIHQSAMGPAHWGMDLAMAKKYLDEEIKEIEPDSAEQLLQHLSPDSSLVRVNLRLYIYERRNIYSLANAFYLTAQRFEPSENLLNERWNIFLELLKEKKISIKIEEADSYFNEMKSKNFPAVHHSQQYQEEYKPAYRVILKSLLK